MTQANSSNDSSQYFEGLGALISISLWNIDKIFNLIAEEPEKLPDSHPRLIEKLKTEWRQVDRKQDYNVALDDWEHLYL